MVIREIRLEDAQQFLELCMKTDAESAFLLFEKNERSTTEEEQRQSIQVFIKSMNSTIFSANDSSVVLGNFG